MTRPIFMRPLTQAECAAMEQGLRASNAFPAPQSDPQRQRTRRPHPPEPRNLSCDEQTARNAIHTFNRQGLPCSTAARATSGTRPACGRWTSPPRRLTSCVRFETAGSAALAFVWSRWVVDTTARRSPCSVPAAPRRAPLHYPGERRWASVPSAARAAAGASTSAPARRSTIVRCPPTVFCSSSCGGCVTSAACAWRCPRSVSQYC